MGGPQVQSGRFGEAGWAPDTVWTFWGAWVGPRDSLNVFGCLVVPQIQSERFGENENLFSLLVQPVA